MYLFLANAKINLNGVPKKKILWDSSCSTVELTIIKYNKLYKNFFTKNNFIKK